MSFDPELVDSVFKRCEDRLRGAEVMEDASPVMADPKSFLAKLDHATGRIILNAQYLKKLPLGKQASERRFLIFHELAHAELLSDHRLRAAIGAGQEEAFCDAIGDLAKCLE